MQKAVFIIVLTVTVLGCSPKVTNFSGKLTYLQKFTVLNDTLSHDVKKYYERIYSDTVFVNINTDGSVLAEGRNAHLGLDFMANISLRNRSANGYKGIDSIVVKPYQKLADDNKKFQIRLHDLSGKEGVVGDNSFEYPYHVNYYTIKDSLYCFRNIQKSYRDFYVDTLLLSSKQLPVGYIIETPDFQLTRELILVEPMSPLESLKLTRKLRRSLP